MDYLKNNISLAKDVSIYLDAIKLFLIQGVMRIDINDVYDCEIQLPPIIEVSKEKSQPLGGVIFGETSQNGFSRIRKKLIEIEAFSKEDLPSIYQITKNRPEVESFEVTPKSSPKAGVLYITATEEEEIGPKQKHLGGKFCRRVSCICKNHGLQTQTKV